MKRLLLLAALGICVSNAHALTCVNPAFGTLANVTIGSDLQLTMTFSHYSYKKASLKFWGWQFGKAYYYEKGRARAFVEPSVFETGHGKIVYYKPYKGGKGKNFHQRTFICNG
jgi:hypothetical protein